MIRNAFAFLVLAALVFLVGCGGSNAPDTELVPAGGTVTLDGEPLANASVQFLPQGDAGAAQGSFGATDESGSFTLRDRHGREGCEVGQFRVVVSKFAQPDGSPIPEGAEGAEAAATGVEHLPARYSDPQQTELKAEIPAGGKTDISIELQSN